MALILRGPPARSAAGPWAATFTHTHRTCSGNGSLGVALGPSRKPLPGHRLPAGPARGRRAAASGRSHSTAQRRCAPRPRRTSGPATPCRRTVRPRGRPTRQPCPARPPATRCRRPEVVRLPRRPRRPGRPVRAPGRRRPESLRPGSAGPPGTGSFLGPVRCLPPKTPAGREMCLSPWSRRARPPGSALQTAQAPGAAACRPRPFVRAWRRLPPRGFSTRTWSLPRREAERPAARPIGTLAAGLPGCAA